jgi:WXG100 family type VII secretion target
MTAAQEMGQGRGTLSRAAGMVADARVDFERLNSQLVERIDSARATWVGQGGTAFNALGHAWSEKQRTITEALDGFEAALRATERDYTATDDIQSSVFTRSQQRLR